MGLLCMNQDSGYGMYTAYPVYFSFPTYFLQFLVFLKTSFKKVKQFQQINEEN